ncbi:hypothetical protein AB833_01740 [Chromatiales bacterium (ex Bugula neritina AB1)]|nr:hypothetical protein AB833_01740 [Chromatiales bacterium (ex Bugula neritina AB1)]
MKDVSIKLSLKLYTNNANNLFKGREKTESKSEIIGVERVGYRLYHVHQVAVDGCPFAANTMRAVEAELTSLKAEMSYLLAPYRRADQSVQVERGDPVAVYDLSKRPVFCVAISEIVGLYDELMMFWYLDRVRGVISARECQRQANKYKKKIRTMMYIGMKYRDYKFRGSSDRTSLEWNEAVKQFGEPSNMSYRSRYYNVPA